METAVAMAFGASVAPEIIVTTSDRMMITANDGYEAIWPRIAIRLRSIVILFRVTKGLFILSGIARCKHDKAGCERQIR